MEPQDLIKELKKQSFRSIYVIYGKDRYRIEQSVEQIKKSMFKADEEEMGIVKFDTSEQAIDEVVYEAESPSFFLDRKLIIVRDTQIFMSAQKESKINHNTDKLIQYLEHPLSTSTIVFVVYAEKLDERKKIVKLLKERRSIVHFPELDDLQLAHWLEKRAQDQGRTLEKAAAELLVQRTGNSMQALAQELDKLCLHSGEGGHISVSLVNEFTTSTIEEDVFSLVDSIVTNNTNKAILLYRELLIKREEPIKIVALIARQIRMMMQIKELESQHYSPQQIASHIGAHPYVVKLTAEKARHYNSKQLALLIQRITDLDYAMKSGFVEKSLGLEMFILSVGHIDHLSFIPQYK